MIFKEYSNPQATGWKGWIENSQGTTIGFVKLTGEIIFNW